MITRVVATAGQVVYRFLIIDTSAPTYHLPLRTTEHQPTLPHPETLSLTKIGRPEVSDHPLGEPVGSAICTTVSTLALPT